MSSRIVAVERGASGDLHADLDAALEEIAARAGELDANPRFPAENFAALRDVGVPQSAADRARSDLRREIVLIRRLAQADASTARILDGHFNGVERLALAAPPWLRESALERVRCGSLLLGVWGADPRPGEGPPAHLETVQGKLVLRGVKTFCSGAGGVDRALVVARDADGSRRLAYTDVSGPETWIDRAWYRANGLRASESHRVEFSDAPVLAVIGGEDELAREPWLSRDSVRSAAIWAGLADNVLAATIAALPGGPQNDLRLHAIGRMRVARASIDRWLEYASWRLPSRTHDTEDPLPAAMTAAETRLAIADAAHLIATEAARVCGSRALIDGGALDRNRRDLELFLLQHRLDPTLVTLGARTIEANRP